MKGKMNIDKLEGNIGGKLTVKGFELDEVPEELQGLTPQIAYDLFDIGVKWGSPRGQSGLAYDVFSPGREYGVYVSLNPYTLMMSLIRINRIDEEMHHTTEGVFAVKIKGKKLGGVILWDRRLTVNEVKDAITGMDKLAMEHVGYMNQETGERLKRPSS